MPVKTFLDYRSENYIDTLMTTRVIFYLQKDHYSAHDGYLQFYGGDQGNFYSMETIDRYTTFRRNLELYVLELHQSPKAYHYERKVLSLVEVLGQIGGTHEIIIVLIGIIVGYYNSRVFALSLIKRICEVHNVPYKEAQHSDSSEHPDKSSNVSVFALN